MKAFMVLYKIMSYLFFLGILTIVLTVVQPMHPQVDRMFRMGAGIVIAIYLVMLFAIFVMSKFSAPKAKENISDSPASKELEE